MAGLRAASGIHKIFMGNDLQMMDLPWDFAWDFAWIFQIYVSLLEGKGEWG